MVLQDTEIYQDDFNALLKTALLKIFNKNAELSIRYYKKYLLLGWKWFAWVKTAFESQKLFFGLTVLFSRHNFILKWKHTTHSFPKIRTFST